MHVILLMSSNRFAPSDPSGTSPAYRLLFLWVALIVYGSLFPWHFDLHRLQDHSLTALLQSWPPSLNRFVVRDMFVNIVLYVPLGVFWRLGLRRTGRTRIVVPVAGGLLLSSFV